MSTRVCYHKAVTLMGQSMFEKVCVHVCTSESKRTSLGVILQVPITLTFLLLKLDMCICMYMCVFTCMYICLGVCVLLFACRGQKIT